MTVKVGVVGTGYWAETVHIPSVASHPEAELAGVWGRNRTESQRIAASVGVVAFDTIDALIEAVDVVDFAIAPHAQLPLALAAARAGKDLLLEKPIARMVPDALELEKAIRDAGSHAVVFMTRLFDPVRRSWLDAQIGAGRTEGRTVNVSGALTSGPYARSSWRREDGGVLWDIGPHVLSQLELVLGPVVQATLLSYEWKGPVELAFVHESGARSRSLMTLYADPADRQDWVEFAGPTGEARSEDVPFDFVVAHSRAVTRLLAQRRSATAASTVREGFTVPVGVGFTRVLAGIESIVDKQLPATVSIRAERAVAS